MVFPAFKNLSLFGYSKKKKKKDDFDLFSVTKIPFTQ